MIPSNGRVNPNTNSRSSQRAPGMRSKPMPNPAIVEMVSEIGTTVSTMIMLDFINVVTFATSNASTKLPHCGSDGHSRPLGSEPDGCTAVVTMLRNGRTVNAIIASRNTRPALTSPRLAFMASLAA